MLVAQLKKHNIKDNKKTSDEILLFSVVNYETKDIKKTKNKLRSRFDSTAIC